MFVYRTCRAMIVYVPVSFWETMNVYDTASLGATNAVGYNWDVAKALLGSSCFQGGSGCFCYLFRNAGK